MRWSAKPRSSATFPIPTQSRWLRPRKSSATFCAPVSGGFCVPVSHELTPMAGQVYATLVKEREDRGAKDIAISRLEQIAPFPYDLVRAPDQTRNARALTPS